ncbi:hypothetical protein ACFL52_04675 [Candidatus Margulisiibacteriota bacterium]
MALFMGKVGRRILKYTLASPRINRAVDLFSNTVHKIIGDRYVPGLTRDMYELYQKTEDGQELLYKRDGIYDAKNSKITTNPIGKCSFFPTYYSISINRSTDPEEMIQQLRIIREIMSNYNKEYGNPSDYAYIVQVLLEQCVDLKALKLWDKEAKELISIYFKQKGYGGHIDSGLSTLLKSCNNLQKLREVKNLLSDYSEKIGDHSKYAKYVLPELLMRSRDLHNLREWNEAVKNIVSDCSGEIGDPSRYIEHVLPVLIKNSLDLKNLQEWDKEVKLFIIDVKNKFKQVYSCLPELLKSCKTLQEFGVAKKLISDYSEKIGDPFYYADKVFPVLMKKFHKLDDLYKWDKKVKNLISEHMESYGNLSKYVKKSMPLLLKKCSSIQELNEWDKIVKELNFEYLVQYELMEEVERGIPENLLQSCNSLEELREVKSLIYGYRELYSEPILYPEDSTIPKLLKECQNLEELKEVKGILLEYGKKVGDPFNYAGCFIWLLKHFSNAPEERALAKKLIKDLIDVGVDPTELLQIIKIFTSNNVSVFDLYNEHGAKFIRFWKNSDSNLPNNLGFFKLIKPENAKQLWDESAKYFMTMKTSLLIPELFSEFIKRNKEGRQKLADAYNCYSSAKIKGQSFHTLELSPEVKEAIGFSLVNSSSLREETYRYTIKELKSKNIPDPNFIQALNFKLAKSQKKGKMTEKEVLFLKERISWIEEAVNNQDKIKDVEAAIEAFPPTDRPGRKPSGKHTQKLLKLLLLKSYLTDPNIKEKIKQLIEVKNTIRISDATVPSRLIEVFKEIKPDADKKSRARIDGLVDVPRLDKVIRRFKKVSRSETVTIDLIPAKTELDYFYGYMGENCTSESPEELLNPAFTPLRVVVNGKIMGSIHTLTLDINGEKAMVLPGIEPKESLLAIIDAEEFTTAVIKNIIDNICIPNGYKKLCLTTDDTTQSNRYRVLKVIQKIINDKPRITQQVQSAFPEQSGYSIEELAVVWSKKRKKKERPNGIR